MRTWVNGHTKASTPPDESPPQQEEKVLKAFEASESELAALKKQHSFVLMPGVVAIDLGISCTPLSSELFPFLLQYREYTIGKMTAIKTLRFLSCVSVQSLNRDGDLDRMIENITFSGLNGTSIDGFMMHNHLLHVIFTFLEESIGYVGSDRNPDDRTNSKSNAAERRIVTQMTNNNKFNQLDWSFCPSTQELLFKEAGIRLSLAGTSQINRAKVIDWRSDCLRHLNSGETKLFGLKPMVSTKKPTVQPTSMGL